MKLYLLLLCQYLHAINFPILGGSSSQHKPWRAVKNQNQTKHGARAKCRNVCREQHFPGKTQNSYPQSIYPNTHTIIHAHDVLAPGSAAIYFKSIANEGIEDEWLAIDFCSCCVCYFRIWRWWWAMITRCSAEVCQLCGTASFWRILCGQDSMASRRKVRANASHILPSLKKLRLHAFDFFN